MSHPVGLVRRAMGFSPRKRKKLFLLLGLVLLLIAYLFLVGREQKDIASIDVRRSPPKSAIFGRSGLNTLPKDSNDTSSTGIFSSTLGKGNSESSILEESISGTLDHTEKISKPNNNKAEFKDSECLQWVSRAPKLPYFLTAVLLIRIYEKDKAKLTTAELKMWLQYLRYAGVEHVYIYDAFVYQNESQLPYLKEFLKDGYVTYIDWHTHNPYTISGTQVTAYQNCINVYQKESRWQAAIDIDEYPFSPKDQSPGFLSRYMKQYEKTHPGVSELSMQNFLFLGKPLNKELMIERVMRRTPQQSNILSKPIYKPCNIGSVSIHHNSIRTGHTANAPVGELRMNHYWGARLQNWGDDTKEILKLTIPDNSMEPIIRSFKQCETLVRRYLRCLQ